MTIRILQRGTPPSERIFRGSCSSCKTQIECTKADGRYQNNQRDGEMLDVACPVCPARIWTYPKKD